MSTNYVATTTTSSPAKVNPTGNNELNNNGPVIATTMGQSSQSVLAGSAVNVAGGTNQAGLWLSPSAVTLPPVASAHVLTATSTNTSVNAPAAGGVVQITQASGTTAVKQIGAVTSTTNPATSAPVGVVQITPPTAEPPAPTWGTQTLSSDGAVTTLNGAAGQVQIAQAGAGIAGFQNVSAGTGISLAPSPLAAGAHAAAPSATTSTLFQGSNGTLYINPPTGSSLVVNTNSYFKPTGDYVGSGGIVALGGFGGNSGLWLGGTANIGAGPLNIANSAVWSDGTSTIVNAPNAGGNIWLRVANANAGAWITPDGKINLMQYAGVGVQPLVNPALIGPTVNDNNPSGIVHLGFGQNGFSLNNANIHQNSVVLAMQLTYGEPAVQCCHVAEDGGNVIVMLTGDVGVICNIGYVIFN